MRRKIKKRRTTRSRCLSIEALENRQLLAFGSLAFVQATETTGDQEGELLRFRLGHDFDEWSIRSSSGTPRGIGFGASKDFGGFAGSISDSYFLNDTPLAGDWAGNGISNIGTARWQASVIDDTKRTWNFTLATDRDQNVDQSYNFPVLFEHDTSLLEAELPIPLAGDLDGLNGDDLAVVDTPESGTLLRWRMAMELSGPVIAYPKEEDSLVEVYFGSSSARPATGYFRVDNGVTQPGIAVVSLVGSTATWSILYPNSEGSYNSDGQTETIVQELSDPISSGDWRPIAGDFDGDGVADLGVVEFQAGSMRLHRRVTEQNSPIVALYENADLSDRIIVGNWTESQWSSNLFYGSTPSASEYSWDNLANWQGSNPLISSTPSPASTVVINDRYNGQSIGNRIRLQGVDRQASTEIIGRTILSDSSINIFAGETIVSQLRIEGGINSFAGPTAISSDDLSGAILSANDAPAPYDTSPIGYGAYATSGSTSFSNSVTIDEPTIVTGGSVEFSGANSQLGTLDVSGTGKVSLSAPGLIIDLLQIGSGGEVEITGTNVSIREISLTDGGVLRMKDQLLSTSGAIVNANGGLIEIEGSNQLLSRDINVGPDGLTLKASLLNGGATLDNRVFLQSNAIVTFDWEGAGSSAVGFTYGGEISGLGSVRKRGDNFLNLTAASSFSGPVFVEAGELRLGVSDALPTTTTVDVAQPALLNLSTNTVQLGVISGTGTIRGDSISQLIVGGTNQPSSYSGTIIDFLSITKEGTDTLTLSGENTFSGSFNVSQGTVIAAADNAIPTSSLITLATDTTLRIESSSQSISNLFGDGAIELASGDLVLEPTNSLLIAGLITGTGSVTKRGSGVATLSAINTYNGPTNVDAGSLQIAATNAIPTSSVTTVAADATLQLSNSGTQLLTSVAGLGTIDISAGNLVLSATNSIIFAGPVVGSGDLTKRGLAALTLTGQNQFSGTTTVEVGLLDLAGNSSLIGTVEVLPDASLRVSGNNVSITELTIDDAGSATLAGSDASISELVTNGVVNVNGNNNRLQSVSIQSGGILRLQSVLASTPADSITIDGGTIEFEVDEPFIDVPITVGVSGGSFIAKLADGGATFTNPISLQPDAVATFDWVGAGSSSIGFAYGGAISGSGTLRKRGQNFLNLTGTSTFTGPVSVQQGELRIGIENSLPTTAAVDVSPGALLNLTINEVELGTIEGLGSIQGDSGSQLTLGGTNLPSNFSGTLAGALSLVKAGTGTVTLSGSNSYAGATTIRDGTLFVAASNAIPASSAVLIETDATLKIENASQTISDLSGDGTIELVSGNVFFDPLTSLEVAGRIAGSGSVTKLGSGTVILSNANSYAGPTSVESGILDVAVNNAIPASSLLAIASEATLKISNSRQQLTSLSGQGTIEFDSGTLVLDVANSTSFAGSVLGVGSILKRGVGPLTFSGSNSFLGTTTVEAGEFSMAGSGAIGGVDIRSDASFRLAGTDVTMDSLVVDAFGSAVLGGFGSSIGSLFISGVVEVTGDTARVASATIEQGGTLRMRGAFASGVSSTIAIDGGTIELEVSEPFLNAPITVLGNGATFIAKLANGGATFSNPISLQPNAVATFDWVGAGSSSIGFAYGGAIIGSGALRKRGENFLNLTGTSTLTGPVSVQQGELRIGVANSLPATAAVDVSPGALLNLSTNAVELGTIDGSGTVQGDAGSQLTLGGTNLSSNFSGTLAGALSLVKAGTGAVTLSGSNSYAGATTIRNGTLFVAASNALPVASLTTVDATGRLEISGVTQQLEEIAGSGTVALDTGSLILGTSVPTSFDGAIIGSGNLTKRGSGDLTFTGTSDFAGTTTIEAGLLGLTGPNSQFSEMRVLADGTFRLSGTNASLDRVAVDPLGTAIVSSTDAAIDILLVNGKTEVTASGSSVRQLTVGPNAILRMQGSIVGVPGSEIAIDGGTIEFETNDPLADSPIAVSAGGATFTAKLSSNGSTFNNSILLNDDAIATFDWVGAESSEIGFVYRGTISGTGSLRKRGSNFLNLTGTSSLSGPVSIQQGELQTGTENALPANVDINIASGALLNLLTNSVSVGRISGGGGVHGDLGAQILVGASDLSSDFEGVLGGSLSLSKQGTGSLTLSNENTYSGSTIVSGGSLRALVDQTLPATTSVTIAAGAEFQLGDTLSTLASIQNAGDVVFGTNPRAALTVPGDIINSATGSFTFNDASLTLGGNLTSLGAFKSATSSLTLNGATGAVQTIEFQGGTSGRWLNVTHSGTGDVVINASLEISNRLRKAGLGAFDINGQSVNANQFSLEAGTVSDSSRTGEIVAASDFDLSEGTVEASLGGDARLTKSGEGSVILAGQNTYRGPTQVSQGRLVQVASTAIPDSTPITVDLLGTLDLGAFATRLASLDNSGEVLLRTSGDESNEVTGDVIVRSGGIVQGGSAPLIVGGDFLNAGTWNAESQNLILNQAEGEQLLDAGTSQLYNVTHQGEGTLVIVGNLITTGTVTQSIGSLDLNSSNINAERFVLEAGRILDRSGIGSISSNQTFDLQQGEIDVALLGTSGLNKTTNGKLLLNARSTPSGTATIDAGTLTLGSATVLDNASGLMVNNSGLLQLADHSVTVRSLAGEGRVDLGSGNLTISVLNDASFDGEIFGSGGLIKQGTGTFTLASPSEYQGPTRIDEGTLALLSNNAIVELSEVSIASGARFDVGSSLQTIRSLQGTGSVNLAGGTLTIGQSDRFVSFDGSINGSGAIQKLGTEVLSLTGAGDFAGVLDIQSGTLQADGEFRQAAITVRDGASLQGTGILGDLAIELGGVLRPGNSPGMLTVNSLDLKTGASLFFEVGGIDSGSQYDQILVTDHANLDGQIVVELVDGFIPVAGDGFDLIRYATSSGTPNLSLELADETVILRSQQLPTAYRLVTFSNIVPVIEAPDDPDPGQAASPNDRLLAQSSGPLFSADDDDADLRETFTFVSITSIDPALPQSDASGWLQDAPGIVPDLPDEPEDIIELETVIDAILTEDLIGDLNSFGSDIRPYNAIELEDAVLKSDPGPIGGKKNNEQDDDVKNDNATTPILAFAVGSVSLIGGLLLFVSTIVFPRRIRRRDSQGGRDIELSSTATEFDDQQLPGSALSPARLANAITSGGQVNE